MMTPQQIREASDLLRARQNFEALLNQVSEECDIEFVNEGGSIRRFTSSELSPNELGELRAHMKTSASDWFNAQIGKLTSELEDMGVEGE